MPWDPPELETDPDAATERILDGLVDGLEGWEPTEGDPLVVLAEEIGRESATTAAVGSDFIELAVAGIGETAFAFPAYQGAAAWLPADLTINNPGPNTVIPDGFTAVGINDSGTEVAFVVQGDTPAPNATTPVVMRAVDVGDSWNTVQAGELTIVTATTTVLDAAATSPSTGGADPETLADYLERLVDYLATLRPGGVRADDLAALARTVPGVDRALGVDLYDPENPDEDSQRTASVFVIDEDGQPPPLAVRQQVQAVLEAAREVNFVIHLPSPNYSNVDVVYAAVADPGADPVVVNDLVAAAVSGWLNRWGTTAEDPQAWEPVSVVRYLELARVAGSVDGVAYLTELTINDQATDLQLTGPAALPGPVTCSGTVI